MPDIKDVPKSEHTGFSPTSVYNPLGEDFEVIWDGKVEGIVPAKGTATLSEFLAWHAAQQIAQKIVQNQWEEKVKRDAIGQIDPYMILRQPAPLKDIDKVQETLIKGKEAFEVLGALYAPPAKNEISAGLEASASPPAPPAEDKEPSPQPKAEIVEEGKEDEAKRREEIRQKRVANMAKARLARKKSKRVTT